MKVSILIVNWNSREYLRECLRSIQETCADLSPQVVVVDGGSFDGCAEMMAADFPDFDFVQSPENIGFGGSNNLGFTSVTGEALLLLNPDTVLRARALEVLVEKLRTLPEAGLIGARLLNSDETLQITSVHPLPTAWNVAFDSDRGRRRWWRNTGPGPDGDPLEVEAVSGACMMLRAQTFRRLGGFDPRYFMYAEDMDLCCRIRRAGLKIYHVPAAVVLHHGGGSSRTQFSKFSTVMIRQALHTYMLANHGRLHALLFRLLLALSAGSRTLLLAIGWLVSGKEGRTVKKISAMKWWAVLRWSLGLESWAKRHFRSPSNPTTHSISKKSDFQPTEN